MILILSENTDTSTNYVIDCLATYVKKEKIIRLNPDNKIKRYNLAKVPNIF